VVEERKEEEGERKGVVMSVKCGGGAFLGSSGTFLPFLHHSTTYSRTYRYYV
jgi:hypothetical protein